MSPPTRRTAAGVALTIVAVTLAVAAYALVQRVKQPARDDQAMARALFADTIGLRGLEQRQNIQLDFFPDDEFDALIDPSASGNEQFGNVAAMYRALGFAVPDDLPSLAQPATRALGIYTTGTNQLSIRSGQLAIDQQMTLVHELAHALVDQHHSLAVAAPTEDARFAFTALAEGDATTVEQRWAEQRGFAPDPSAEDEASEQAEYQPLPEPLEVDGILPYLAGNLYVERLIARGGWAAVDTAYDDIPISAAEVFQPERRTRSGLVRVGPPDVWPTESTTLWTGGLGAHHLFVALGQVLDFETAWTVTAAWEADRYRATSVGDQVCVSWAIVARVDAALEQALRQWTERSDIVEVHPLRGAIDNSIDPPIDVEGFVVRGCDPGSTDQGQGATSPLDTNDLAGAVAMRYALMHEFDLAGARADCLVGATGGAINGVSLFDIFWMGVNPGDLTPSLDAAGCTQSG